MRGYKAARAHVCACACVAVLGNMTTRVGGYRKHRFSNSCSRPASCLPQFMGSWWRPNPFLPLVMSEGGGGGPPPPPTGSELLGPTRSKPRALQPSGGGCTSFPQWILLPRLINLCCLQLASLGEKQFLRPLNPPPPSSRHLKMIVLVQNRRSDVFQTLRQCFLAHQLDYFADEKPPHHPYRKPESAASESHAPGRIWVIWESMLRVLSSGLQLSASRRAPGEAKLGKDNWAALGRVQVTVTQEFHWG